MAAALLPRMTALLGRGELLLGLLVRRVLPPWSRAHIFATNLRLDEATRRGSLCEFQRARRNKLKSDEWPVHGPICEMAAKALGGAMQGCKAK